MKRFTAAEAREAQKEHCATLQEIYSKIEEHISKCATLCIPYIEIKIDSEDYYGTESGKWDLITRELEKDGYTVNYNEYTYEFKISW
jgi:hypothetical protein